MSNSAMKRSKDDDGINLYTTPPWATQSFLEKEELTGGVWEPACGMGHIAKVVEEFGYNVQSTDLFDHGYGQSGIDFLEYFDPDIETVITNPPYDSNNIQFDFLKHALAQTNVKKVCFFLPAQFLGTDERAIWLEHSPYFARYYTFADRVKCLTNGDEKQSSNNTGTSFAWFVFDKDHDGSPAQIHFLYKPDELKTKNAVAKREGWLRQV